MELQLQPKYQYYSEAAHIFNADYVQKKEPFIMTQYHYHNVNEIHYFFEGERRLFCKDRIYHVTPGDLVIIKSNVLHSLCDWDKPGYTRILIDFQDKFLKNIKSDMDLLNCFNRDIIVMHLNEYDKKILENSMINITNEFLHKKNGYKTMLLAQMTEFLITLNRMMDNYTDKREMPSPQYLIISEIMKFISEHYCDKLTLTILGNQFGYSRNYLCSLFKKISGFSIVSYINGTRITKAQEMLKDNHNSIADVAQKCGFESSTHFGRVFKEIVGCSPYHYKRSS